MKAQNKEFTASLKQDILALYTVEELRAEIQTIKALGDSNYSTARTLANSGTFLTYTTEVEDRFKEYNMPLYKDAMENWNRYVNFTAKVIVKMIEVKRSL